MIWIGLHTGVGRVATGSLETASGLMPRIIGLLGAGAIPVGLGALLLASVRAERKRESYRSNVEGAFQNHEAPPFPTT
jgi:hypothetical protein